MTIIVANNNTNTLGDTGDDEPEGACPGVAAEPDRSVRSV
ncbi:hypothetical protein F4553_000063 [Allocatelliglobosispora scoriae]|uniref:Uncharacterized protein n=1 Tax=Allocatelliglobosispora scoriae TaxID=643052 RepID=A0A841BEG7_9ACTN|nr:hypothetical protein [Allocatelliglobosispora scoriae]